MENSKKQQMETQKEEELKYFEKQQKMRCIEIASSYGMPQERDAGNVIKQAKLLFDYLNE